jgi:hypothetical protein
MIPDDIWMIIKAYSIAYFYFHKIPETKIRFLNDFYKSHLQDAIGFHIDIECPIFHDRNLDKMCIKLKNSNECIWIKIIVIYETCQNFKTIAIGQNWYDPSDGPKFQYNIFSYLPVKNEKLRLVFVIERTLIGQSRNYNYNLEDLHNLFNGMIIEVFYCGRKKDDHLKTEY